MKMSRTMIQAVAGGGVVIVGIFLYSVMFIVDQTEQAMVLRFGEPRGVITEPGLHFKTVPWENVIFYEKRLLNLDPPAEEILLADQKRIVVDTFTRFQISDPLKFFQAVRTEAQARSRLGNFVNSSTRRVLGNVTLPTLLSAERNTIMDEIRNEVNEPATAIGVQVAEVRLRRADLPEQTSESVYSRMRSEREREARENRAQGQEIAQQIRARAERERTVIIAEAEREAQILRGNGDAESTRIYAEAYSIDPQFYDFYRSLEAYRNGLAEGASTTMVLSPDSDFFRFFNEQFIPGQLEARAAPAEPNAAAAVGETDGPEATEGPGQVLAPLNEAAAEAATD